MEILHRSRGGRNGGRSGGLSLALVRAAIGIGAFFFWHAAARPCVKRPGLDSRRRLVGISCAHKRATLKPLFGLRTGWARSISFTLGYSRVLLASSIVLVARSTSLRKASRKEGSCASALIRTVRGSCKSTSLFGSNSSASMDSAKCQVSSILHVASGVHGVGLDLDIHHAGRHIRGWKR